MDLAELLRSAIKASGKTQYALAKETGIAQSRISAFLAGGDIRLAHAGKLMDAVGMSVKVRKKRRPDGKETL